MNRLTVQGNLLGTMIYAPLVTYADMMPFGKGSGTIALWQLPINISAVSCSKNELI